MELAYRRVLLLRPRTPERPTAQKPPPSDGFWGRGPWPRRGHPPQATPHYLPTPLPYTSATGVEARFLKAGLGRSRRYYSRLTTAQRAGEDAGSETNPYSFSLTPSSFGGYCFLLEKEDRESKEIGWKAQPGLHKPRGQLLRSMHRDAPDAVAHFAEPCGLTRSWEPRSL
jgi:hypothetical protein